MSTLFVGNLSNNVTSPKLSDIFSMYGACYVEVKTNSLVKKGLYAFIEYSDFNHANTAKLELNRTNLNGINGKTLCRIDFSKRCRNLIKMQLEQGYNNTPVEMNMTETQNVPEKFESKRSNTCFSNGLRLEERKSNSCFICKLQGHFAKDCILTRDFCFECGDKGHIAKDCSTKVREADVLTENRIRAILVQQVPFKYVTPGLKIRNIVNFLMKKRGNIFLGNNHQVDLISR